jgi:hypothetical protein
MDYVARDEDGTSHIGWSQDEANSCGPACVYMIESNRRQCSLVGGEKRIRQLIARYFSRDFVDKFDRMINDFNARGIDMGALRDALRAEGYACTMKQVLPAPLSGARFPMICHIAWPNQGGHFIVVAGVTKGGKAICLDPWYGLQQIPGVSFPAYPAQCSPTGQCNVGAGGTFSGWCITFD